MLRNPIIGTSMALGFGLGLLLALLWGFRTPVIHAQGPDGYTTYYVAPSCVGAPTPCYTSVQAAVDATDDPGDLIKVATGTYTDVSVRPRRDTVATGVVTQVAYISKTVTIRGGYTTTNWFTPDPNANPTTLDAQGQGRVLYVTGNISTVFEGLRLTGGDPTALEGQEGALVFEDAGGGIVVITATATISNCQIFNNSASKGGGVFLDHSNADLVGNAITSNTAHYIGGVLVSKSEANLRGNLIAANIAEGTSCGGLYLHRSSTMVTGNTIVFNTTNRNGGGIVIVGGDDILVNNIVADNQAGAEGGGIIIYEASPRLFHTTIARNSGSNGDGIYVSQHNWIFSSVKLTNTILVSHTEGIHVRDGNTVTLEATLWGSDSWANVTDTIGLVISTTNIAGDPAFVAPEAGDYHIASTSKAIDAGVNAYVTVDIDADSRPAGKGYDIGADEFWRKVYLPLVLRQ
jgi:hypothetical protein